MTHMFEPRTAQSATFTNVSRRSLMRGAFATGTLIVGVSLLPARARADWVTGASKMPGGTVNDPHVFVAIDPSGLVTILTNRSEMGTGVRTSLPMVVADEMEADWSQVRVQQAPGDEKKYGNQDTDGSRSTRHFVQPMRQCGVRDAHDAGASGGETLGRRCIGGEGRKSQGGSSGVGQHARLRRTRQGSERIAGTRSGDAEAEGPEPIPLYRHWLDSNRRSVRHHRGPRDLRHRCQDPRDEVRCRCPSTGRRRQVGIVRCERGTQGSRRREGRRGSGLAVAFQVHAGGRRRRGGAQHRLGNHGTRETQDRLG